jgi:ribosomal protein S18 acetylase RimI-like enzyme
MLDRWFSTIKLPISFKQFNQLPQNPAYKYEYSDKTAWLSPRPKFQSARLELRAREESVPLEIDAQDTVCIRRFEDRDWPRLSRPFARAFDRVQPFASLSDRRQLESARACLKFTREGGDGPVIVPACHVAITKEHGYRVGAILVTLIPEVDLDGFFSMRWKKEPPADCIERRLGRPHLTWIFVSPWHAYHGIGTALLAHAERSLLALGYMELISSFIWGNTSSMLWHWRNGFQLLPYAGSMRNFRKRARKPETTGEIPGKS